nr:immunoglobulin heavy chain junction region [Mus musculus]
CARRKILYGWYFDVW